MSYLEQHRDTLLPEFRRVWEATGAKNAGTWREVFGPGPPTDEIFMAWNYARYVQYVTAAGKAEYPLPMYVNTWLAGSQSSPGEFPSGGPLPEVMDVWKAAGTAIDLYAPDIYAPNVAEWCDRYNRGGNPLFIPETGGGTAGEANVFYAVGQRETIGFSPFAIDAFEGTERPALTDPNGELGKSYQALIQLAPFILEHEGEGKMAGFTLNREHPKTTLELNGYRLNVSLDEIFGTEAETGFGLVIATGPAEFLGAGSGFRVSFQLKDGGPAHVGIGSVEEGTFSDNVWIPGRRLNGDENDQGKGWRFAPHRIRIEKVVLYRY